MCNPAALAIGQGVIGAGGAIAEYGAQSAAVDARNRAKLKNFEEENNYYNLEVKLDRAEYRNNIWLADIDHDKTYAAMIDQWIETDVELDELFAENDQKLEQAVQKMYRESYAGTQTGRTAARLAGASAKALGYAKSQILHNLMMGKKQAVMAKEAAWRKAEGKMRDTWEQIRFAPIHGPTPVAPDLERKPSKASTFLRIAGAAMGALPTVFPKTFGDQWKAKNKDTSYGVDPGYGGGYSAYDPGAYDPGYYNAWGG